MMVSITVTSVVAVQRIYQAERVQSVVLSKLFAQNNYYISVKVCDSC